MSAQCDPIQPLVDHASLVDQRLSAQESLWAKGFTRRRFLGGVGLMGAAALGSQLVTAKTAFAASADTNGNTFINIFLRGGADGLRMLVPASSQLGLDYLVRVRPDLVPGPADLLPIPGANGWALNKGFAALLPYLATNELTFVPAVTSPGSTRSHFNAQQNLDSGTTATSSTGWLDRVLSNLGPGTTFRAMGMGETNSPLSYAGPQPALVLNTLKGFTTPSWKGYEARTLNAIDGLFRGFTGSVTDEVSETLQALTTVANIQQQAGAQNGAVYPTGGFATALADVATLLRAEVGLQVCTLDIGGWDTHTMEAADLDNHIAALSAALAAFMQDLGPARRSRVTIMVMSEFGRRVAQNGNLGTDHGLGSVAMLLGGGLNTGGVAGKWNPLSDGVLDHGDVPGLNDAYNLMGEVVADRLGVGSLSSIFPNHSFKAMDVSKAA